MTATVCPRQELNLSSCNISDQMCADLAKALETNETLVHLNLEDNKVGNDGATALANALTHNRMLMQLNLLNQKGSRFGDATLHAFDDMFAANVTLLKIIWRLESRQSFRLTKMLTRNNDIDRRIKAGRDYADLLPEKAKALSDTLVQQRAAAAGMVGTPRQGGSSVEPSGRTSQAFSSRSSGDMDAPRPNAALSGSSVASSKTDSWRSVSIDGRSEPSVGAPQPCLVGPPRRMAVAVVSGTHASSSGPAIIHPPNPAVRPSAAGGSGVAGAAAAAATAARVVGRPRARSQVDETGAGVRGGGGRPEGGLRIAQGGDHRGPSPMIMANDHCQ